MRAGIVGLGLIGGSFAKAYSEAGHEVLAFDRNESVLSFAQIEGAVSAPLTKENIGTCDIVLVAIYPEAAIAYVTQMLPYIGKKPMVIDCCGTKRVVCRALFPLAQEHGFTYLGGHPMAGSEKTGLKNANEYLLENAYYILTPTTKTSPERLEEFRSLVTQLGAVALVLDYHLHDYATAAISHLPHIIAYSLVNLVKKSDDADETMKTIAAGGFKDLTRIASSSPVMWQNICQSNSEQIVRLIDAYEEMLEKTKHDILSSDADALLQDFQSAKDYRDSIAITNKGPIKEIYELYLDLLDEAGGIATVATILASNHLSIKNIGIIHNREFEDGVLRLEMYDRISLDAAVQLLRKHHYTIYER